MSLEPRILKGIQAEYTKAQFVPGNPSGFRPIGDHVLILMDQVADKTSGGILLEPGMIEKMNHASESGVIVAVGDASFRFYGDGSAWTDYKPKAGDRVFTEKYAGRELMGRDGKTYRMMTYTCVAGLETPEDEKPSKTRKKG